MPLYMHWIVAHFRAGAVFWLERLLNPIVNTLHVALFATVVASYDKGLTVTDHLRTVARQCYAWSMPYAVVFADKSDVDGGEIKSEAFRQRLEMFVRDVHVYGGLLAEQRRRDLNGTEPGFLARLRK